MVAGKAILLHRRAKVLVAAALIGVMGMILGGGQAARAGSWKVTTFPSLEGTYLNSVHFPTSEVGYAVGNANTILKTTDGGFTWTRLPRPLGASSLQLRGVFFVSPDTGLVVTDSLGVLRTANGGTSWQNVFAPAGYSWRSLAFADDLRGIVVGDKSAAGAGAAVARTTDGGLTWSTPVDIPAATAKSLVSVAYSQDGSPNGRWVAVGCKTLAGCPLASLAPSSDTGAAVYSTDAGATWTASSSAIPRSLRGLWLGAGGPTATGYAVGINGLILKTTDGGATWLPQSSGTGRDLHGVVFEPGGLRGSVVGATALETTDGGVSWVPSAGVEARADRSPATETSHGLGSYLLGLAINGTTRVAVGGAMASTQLQPVNPGVVLRYDPGDTVTPSASINDIAAFTEGDPGTTQATLTVLLSSAPARPVTLSWGTSDGTGIAGQDYEAKVNQTLTFAAGETQKTITVNVLGNTDIQPNRTFYVNLSSPTNAVIYKSRGSITITDDDERFLSAATVLVLEGNSGPTEATVTVTLTPASPVETTVSYRTEDGDDPDPKNNANAGEDYQAATGTLTFPAGVSELPVLLNVNGDNDPEQSEGFYIILHDPIGAIVKPQPNDRTKVTIINDDQTALIVVDDVKVGPEGGEGTTTEAVFKVHLIQTTGGVVTVDYATADKWPIVPFDTDTRRATPDTDFGALSGTLTFPQGVTEHQVVVTVKGDEVVEDNEEFLLVLSNQSPNAEIVRAQGLATITDDDLPAGGLAFAGSRRRATSGGKLWGDPARGIIYEVGSNQTAVWDLETRSVVKTLPVGGRAWADEARHRLFVMSGGLTVIDASCPIGPSEENCPKIVAQKGLPPLAKGPWAVTSYTGTDASGETQDWLYTVASVESEASDFNAGLYQVYMSGLDLTKFMRPDWDPATVLVTDPGAFWTQYLPGCPNVGGNKFSSHLDGFRSLVRGGAYVGVWCVPGSLDSTTGAQPEQKSGVVRVEQDRGGQPLGTEFFTSLDRSIYADTFSDPVSGRIFSPWGWVFDVGEGGWLNKVRTYPSALDYQTGRLYLPYGTSFEITDARLPQVPPGRNAWVSGLPGGNGYSAEDTGVVDWARRQVIYFGNTVPPSIFFIKDGTGDLDPPPPPDDPDFLTLDVEEVEGVTERDYIASTQAYAAKMRWVGGLGNSGARTSSLTDPWNYGQSAPHMPSTTTREVTLAAVHGSALTPQEATAKAFGVQADYYTESETDPVTYYNKYFVPNGAPPPPSEFSPGSPLFEHALAQCHAAGEAQTVPAADGRSAVTCDHVQGEVDARASYLGATAQGAPFEVGAARSLSSSYLDPQRGLVARSEAELSGVTLRDPSSGSEVHFGTIRSVAETWATGRKKRLVSGSLVSGPGYGAEGSLTRSFSDVWVKAPGQEPRQICGKPLSDQGATVGDDRVAPCDPTFLVKTLNRTLGFAMRFAVPEPDPRFFGGSPGGALAEVVLNPGDLGMGSIMEEEPAGRLEVPALVVTVSTETTKASRVLLRLAAVMTSTNMQIVCIYGPTPDRTACNPDPGTLPSTLAIHLTDQPEGKGNPLPGGKFSLYSDSDGDGILNTQVDLPIELPDLAQAANTACTTADDGVGDCLFEGLYAGKYFIHQVSAPEGYAPVDDFGIDVLGDNAYTIDLANLPAIGFISINLADNSNAPLAGGAFDLYQDADSDEALGPHDQKLATCTTIDDGKCRFNQDRVSDDLLVAGCILEEVESGGKSFLVVKECTEADQGNFLVAPFGGYLMVEAQAPKDYQVSDGFAFTIDQPKQYYGLTFSNGLQAIAGTEGTDVPTFRQVSVQAPPSLAPRVASRSNRGLVAFVRKVFDGFKFLLASPPQALRTAALWAFFTLPLILALRRRWLPQT